MGGCRPPSLQIPPHTHILLARSPAPYSPARPFSNGIFRARPPPSPPRPPPSHMHAEWMVSATKTPTSSTPSQDCSFPAVYVGVVECASASPYTYSSSTHRFPDERTPIEVTPLSATSAELVLGLGLGLGLVSHSSSHAPSHAPLLLATLLSHNIPFPRVHQCVMGKLVHTCLGSSYLMTLLRSVAAAHFFSPAF